MLDLDKILTVYLITQTYTDVLVFHGLLILSTKVRTYSVYGKYGLILCAAKRQVSSPVGISFDRPVKAIADRVLTHLIQDVLGDLDAARKDKGEVPLMLATIRRGDTYQYMNIYSAGRYRSSWNPSSTTFCMTSSLLRWHHSWAPFETVSRPMSRNALSSSRACTVRKFYH